MNETLALFLRIIVLFAFFVAGGLIDLTLIYFANDRLVRIFKKKAYIAYQVLVIVGYSPFLLLFFFSLKTLSVVKVELPTFSWILTTLLIIAGVALNFYGVRDLGLKRWNSKQKFEGTKKPVTLITTGIYKWIRHPTYLGQILIIYGLALLFPSIPIILACMMFHLYLVLIHSRIEERQLEKIVGEPFIEHKKITGAFLPRLWSN